MKITMSASCSMLPDSRRSASIGRLSWRYSSWRLSCDSVITGASSSRARIFSPRESSDTSTWRLSERRRRRHQLQVVDDDQAEVAVARLDAPRLGAHLHHRAVRVVVDEERRLGEPADRLVELRPLVLGELAGLRACAASICASAASRRFVSSRWPISIEKNSTGLRRVAARRAAPRRARTTSCPGRGGPRRS